MWLFFGDLALTFIETPPKKSLYLSCYFNRNFKSFFMSVSKDNYSPICERTAQYWSKDLTSIVFSLNQCLFVLSWRFKLPLILSVSCNAFFVSDINLSRSGMHSSKFHCLHIMKGTSGMLQPCYRWSPVTTSCRSLACFASKTIYLYPYIHFLHQKPQLLYSFLELFSANELISNKQHLIVFLLLRELWLLHTGIWRFGFATIGIFVPQMGTAVRQVAH
jgi:hypothetical protein